MGSLAAQIDGTDVRLTNIGPQQVKFYITPQGGNVYLPVWEQMSQIIDQALLPPASSRAARSAVQVEVWNGTGHEDWDQLASDRLYNNGFTPIIIPSDRRDYAQTSIQVYGTHAKGTGLPEIQEMFHVSDQNISYLDTDQGDIKLRFIIGADYQTCP